MWVNHNKETRVKNDENWVDKMSKNKITSIRVENKFQVEKENHVVVMEFDMEPEGVIIQLRTSDLPSFHHATILEQYKKISIDEHRSKGWDRWFPFSNRIIISKSALI